MSFSSFVAPAVESFLKKPTVDRAILGGLGGLGTSVVENNTALDDSTDSTKYLNNVLGATVGGAMGMAAPHKDATMAKMVAAYATKLMGMQGLDAAKKYINIQQPIAETNLHTAELQKATADTIGEQAKHFKPSDYAQLGMAAGGLGLAGGAAYYLNKEYGPNKPKKQPTMRVTLPIGANSSKGSVEMEGPLDPLDMSKQLYTQLQRDKKRRLQLETRLATMHRKTHPKQLQDSPEVEKVASYQDRLAVINSMIDCLI